ncbi:MAG: Cof-type HAD-IIB family hydrolase [Clostridiales bacterium]
MIKAVFFDMDGTLVAYPEGIIPLSARKAIEKLREKGILICLATGRHRVELESLDFLGTVSFDAVASLNGQYCYTPKAELFSNTIAAQDLSAFLDYQNKQIVPCVISEKNRMYCNVVSEGFSQAMAGISTALPEVGTMAGLEKRDVLQFCAYCNENVAEDLDKAMPSAKVVRWNPDFVDIIPQSGGKTNGIAKILQHFNITWQEVIAFGDGQNDIDMLKAAEISVAMGNADPKLKEHAAYITADANKDGIALGLQHFGLC